MSLLSVQNVGKAFRSYGSEWQRFARWFGLPVKASQEHWVLRHVNFEIQQGEAIGIIGQNGAGKSTLLKMITGTSQPSEGQVQVNGKIAAILELGMGFNPDLTGRENAYHGLGLMGYSHADIEQVMPELESFAEVGEYFDQPIRVYSSGMQMRVAFAVVTAFRPEILIVDEALSVGDSYFQHKSFSRIKEFKDKGTTFLFVSHDSGAIKILCDRAILIENGLVIKEGKAEEVVDFYSALTLQDDSSSITQKAVGNRFETISGSGEATFIKIELFNTKGESATTVHVGETIELHLTVKVNQDVESLALGCGITDRLGQMMFGTNTIHTKQVVNQAKEGDIYLFNVRFLVSLGVGSYAVHSTLVENDSQLYKRFEWRDGAFIFEVVNIDKPYCIGCMWNEMTFTIEKN